MIIEYQDINLELLNKLSIRFKTYYWIYDIIFETNQTYWCVTYGRKVKEMLIYADVNWVNLYERKFFQA